MEDGTFIQRVAADFAGLGILPSVGVSRGVGVGGGIVPRQSEKVLDGPRRTLFEQFDGDVAVGRSERYGRVVRI